jgi:hypothetical protein
MAISSFTPVAYEYREVIEEAHVSGKSGKIFFFNDQGVLDDAQGKISAVRQLDNGVFIETDNGAQIRIDRIITLYGIPGAAYDEFDAFGRTCLDCTGGYPL